MYQYEIQENNGTYRVRVNFTNSFGNIDKLEKDYIEKVSAYLFVEAHLRTWLKDALIRYVHHADILKNTGKQAFYNTIRKTEAMIRCKEYLKVIQMESLRGICYQLLNMEQDLRAILPSPGNSSYQSSKSRLEEMIWLAVKIRKQIKQTA